MNPGRTRRDSIAIPGAQSATAKNSTMVTSGLKLAHGNPGPRRGRASTGDVGDAYDNTMAESWFGTIKVELLYRHIWRTRQEAEMAIFRWIEGWYNPRRIQARLGWRSPQQYEAAYAAAQDLSILATAKSAPVLDPVKQTTLDGACGPAHAREGGADKKNGSQERIDDPGIQLITASRKAGNLTKRVVEFRVDGISAVDDGLHVVRDDHREHAAAKERPRSFEPANRVGKRLPISRPDKHVPRIHRCEDQTLVNPEPQLRCGIPMQRPIRHHHTTSAEQGVHLRHRQALIQPRLDLLMLAGDGLPRFAFAGGPTRPRPGDHHRHQLVRQLTRIAVPVQPTRAGPVHIPMHRLAVRARQPGHLPQPSTLQPQPQDLPDLDHRYLPVAHAANKAAKRPKAPKPRRVVP
jgi:hypothetical protein